MHPYQRMSLITALACGLSDTRFLNNEKALHEVHHCLVCGAEFTPVSFFQSRCPDHVQGSLQPDSRAAA